MTIADILAIVRAPDHHWSAPETDCYLWGVTQEPEAIARVALSTTAGGRFPFALETDDGVHTHDPRVIEAMVRDPAWRRKYGLSRGAVG